MPKQKKQHTTSVQATLDGNAACAQVAYATNEVIIVYPITPSTPMGEAADVAASKQEENIYGTVPTITEMQSEAGVAGAMHGALTTGALATTFTASQGLLLMIPNMYKIAGELLPTVFHVAARSIATHALSIFGDHSDVMAVRSTGWAMLCSSNVQEAHDFALVAQAATLRSRIPFIHFFDGFRTSHEVQKVDLLSHDDLRALLPEQYVYAHRERELSPVNPVVRGTSQNPDVFFQSREAVNSFYEALPGIMETVMQEFFERTGRQYKLFDYVGHPDAERVVVMLGSGSETMEAVVTHLAQAGERVGLVKVRLYRPFVSDSFIKALPTTTKSIAVLDRTKEPGAGGEPLFLDVRAALYESTVFTPSPLVVGGRYGIGSKEFNPAMAKAVLDNLSEEKPKNHFTVGIKDDVTFTSLDYGGWRLPSTGMQRMLFFGLGSDGTVGAAKNIVKIVGDETEEYTQGYFVYDSKKSGSITVSHLRFSAEQIKRTYLIDEADFISCNAFPFLFRTEMVEKLRTGGTFLLNAPYPPSQVWEHLPLEVQQLLIQKRANFFVIDAYGLAASVGLGGRINTIMMAAFFELTGVLSREKAHAVIDHALEKTYGTKGEQVVAMNKEAVRMGFEQIHEVSVPRKATSATHVGHSLPEDAPVFVKSVTKSLLTGHGDDLPVSAFPADGSYPTGTSKYEKRNVAQQLPVWNSETCIQCGRCAFVCPHAAIRMKLVDAEDVKKLPKGFQTTPAKGPGETSQYAFTIQVSPEDCTGCTLCADVCPVGAASSNVAAGKDPALRMEKKQEIFAEQQQHWDVFEQLPEQGTELFSRFTLKGSQLHEPLFEFSGACSGCGQTPYVKLLTQLFGERLLIANATGCSSIYGGNLPTTPYTKNKDGRGPAWSNSLFEDAAEFGFGMKITENQRRAYVQDLLEKTPCSLLGIQDNAGLSHCENLVAALLHTIPSTEEEHELYYRQVVELRQVLAQAESEESQRLLSVINTLIPKSHWIMGGDGWAYDIGFGGLDHVLASGEDVNILVLDTGAYSNTGGQASKATPRAASAGLMFAGKERARKDLGAIAMSYGSVYVGKVALLANMNQAIKVFKEAAAYRGTSIIIAYGTCIAHGFELANSVQVQKLAVNSGFWPLYRYNPDDVGQKFHLDSKEPDGSIGEFLKAQNRFRITQKHDPDHAKELLAGLEKDVQAQFERFRQYGG